MYNNISVDALKKLGIYELRNLARQIGVYSPTSFKKEELIDKVMAIVQGIDEPYKKKTNQGRPAKQMAGLDEILNIFVPPLDEKNMYTKPFKNESMYPSSFMQHMTINPDNLASCSGYVRILKDYAVILKNGYFEGNDKTYYITQQLLKNLSIKDGDFVKGLYYVLDDDKPKLVQQLQFINGQVADSSTNHNRENFEELNAVYPNVAIKLSKAPKSPIDFEVIDKICPIGEGSRVLINYEKNFDIDEFLSKLINNLSRSNFYNVTLFSTDERPEDVNYLINECIDMKVLNREVGSKEQMFAEQMLNTFDHLIRQVEYGNNQILIIKNMQKLYNFFIKYYILVREKNETEAKVLAIEKIKNYMLFAKNTQNNHAFTVIICNSQVEEINELCNCFINLKNNAYLGTDVYVDCLSSYTVKPNLLISKEDNKKYNMFRDGLTQDNVVEKLSKIY